MLLKNGSSILNELLENVKHFKRTVPKCEVFQENCSKMLTLLQINFHDKCYRASHLNRLLPHKN